MTIVKPLESGVECIQTMLMDGEDEVRVHVHDDKLVGLRVKNAVRGLLYEVGMVVMECQE